MALCAQILRGICLKRLICCSLLGLLLLYWFAKSPVPISDDIRAETYLAPPNPSLTYQNREFFLDGKKFRILSGSIHYFRIMPQYWQSVLLKLKACGLNTLETYVPWNLHEPSPERYNFEGILNLREFIKLAHSMNIYVILRPGPYICSEWDFGGIPSWLLRTQASLRSNSAPYLFAVERYFARLLPKVVDLQHSTGGPIIAVQVENEFGTYSNEVQHLEYLRELLTKNGITELLITSDGLEGMLRATLSGALPTANFGNFNKGQKIFKAIGDSNPKYPLMVMEFWSGWFDHWGNKHHSVKSLSWFQKNFQQIINYNASFNFYMFMGGTNFGFMAGANADKDKYEPDVTSYDYDALLTESGDVTPKYMLARKMIYEQILKPEGHDPLPAIPSNNVKKSYGTLLISSYLSFKQILYTADQLKLCIREAKMDPMELLNIYNNAGQSYGYILYEKSVGKVKSMKIGGYVRDRAHVLINSEIIATVDWKKSDQNIIFPENLLSADMNLGILVENLGRVNFVRFGEREVVNSQFKGLHGDVYLDEQLEENWNIYVLDFSKEFLDKVSDSIAWQEDIPAKRSPALYQATFTITETPSDTFFSMKGWTKGIVIVNKFNLGRYWNTGPQKTLYVPAPILRVGVNVVYIFEEEHGSKEFLSANEPDLGDIDPKIKS